jgi:hypothetical protein
MRRLFALPVRCLALAGVLTSCGDDDGGTASFAALFEERDNQIETICECYDELGWDSRSRCRNGQNPILPSTRGCVEEALAQNSEASGVFFDCYLPLERDLSACLADRLECDDAESIDPCIADFNVGWSDCTELPSSVERVLDDKCKVDLGAHEVETGSAGGMLCNDDCEYAGDEVCDDGGPNSDELVACELGTDCTDCGPR